jgi:rhamnosyltransferase
MTDQPLCSIIIRAYNEEEHIGRLLTGILKQSIKNVEIILVDSGSTDATVAIASRFPVKIVHIDQKHFTFGRSLNLGCASATGKNLVFVSAHVFPVYDDWLDHLISPFKGSNVALVYGKQQGAATTRFSEHQQFARMYPNVSNFEQHHPLCNNANAAIRRELWEKHPYDETLSGLEDLEWATWALSEGYHLAYTAEAAVVHVHDESPRQVFRRYEREAIALSRIRPEERFGILQLVKLYLSNVRGDLRQAMVEGRFWVVLWEVLWFRWMQFWGTYSGFRHAGPITDEVIQAFYYPRSVIRESPRIDQAGRNQIDYGEIGQPIIGDSNHES